MKGNLTVEERISNIWNKQVELNQNVTNLTEELKVQKDRLKEENKKLFITTKTLKALSLLIAGALFIIIAVLLKLALSL